MLYFFGNFVLPVSAQFSQLPELNNTLVYIPHHIPLFDPEARHKMKVACLQFAPDVGKLQENIARADRILLEAQLPFDVDWLVLPELAFTGM